MLFSLLNSETGKILQHDKCLILLARGFTLIKEITVDFL